MRKRILKHGRVIDPANNIDDLLDVLIVDGKIAEIAKNIQDSTAEIEDVRNRLVVPGFVEMHAHMRDFNEPERETFFTGSYSALCGGYTTVGVMPNSDPIIDTVERVEQFFTRAKESSLIRLYPFAAVTKGRQGKEIVDMEALTRAGAVAFSDDGNAIKDAVMMREILEKTKLADRVVDLHCEDKEYTQGGVVNAGALAEELHVKGVSSVGEDIEIARDLIIQEEIKGHLHIAHLGSERSIELVRFFRNRNVNFTCEVIPHQFSKTEEIVREKGVLAKVKPPFRNQRDLEGIRKGLHDHLIDVIATDHCPYAPEELEGGLTATSLFGLAGFEITLPLSLELVRKEIIDYSYLIRCLTCNPARIMRLPNRGTLSIGADADITVIDPDIKWRVDLNQFKSKGKNNPYEGEMMQGKAILTMIGGEIRCRDWQLVTNKTAQ